MHNVPYRCPACSGFKQCQHGAKLGLASPASIQEQQDIQSMIQFINPDPPQPGYYSSKLPLLPDYKNYISSNYHRADLANKKMLRQLQKHPEDAEEISNSYNELIKKKFIITLKEFPQDQQDYIRNNPSMLFIHNAVAYKSNSHSTKVRICWDATRMTGNGNPLNTQLMRGTSSYSMTKSLLFFRRGKFALSCDISKFYNRLMLHPDHYNLHLSLWRPNMDPESIAQIFVLVRQIIHCYLLCRLPRNIGPYPQPYNVFVRPGRRNITNFWLGKVSIKKTFFLWNFP